jgi:HK97 gp10 family phage protein
MGIIATAKFSPGNIKGVLDLYVQVKAFAKVQRAQAVVLQEAQSLCPVDTGELRDSLRSEAIQDDGSRITGAVSANTDYAAYVEFGTGKRGAASPGAGSGPYSPTWPGMPAQPYLRPALDQARQQVLEEFQS